MLLGGLPNWAGDEDRSLGDKTKEMRWNSHFRGEQTGLAGGIEMERYVHDKCQQ